MATKHSINTVCLPWKIGKRERTECESVRSCDSRNLINRHFLNQAHITDERLYKSILLGVAGGPMPAHDHLSDQTILNLISFIRDNIKEDTE